MPPAAGPPQENPSDPEPPWHASSPHTSAALGGRLGRRPERASAPPLPRLQRSRLPRACLSRLEPVTAATPDESRHARSRPRREQYQVRYPAAPQESALRLAHRRLPLVARYWQKRQSARGFECPPETPRSIRDHRARGRGGRTRAYVQVATERRRTWHKTRARPHPAMLAMHAP